LLLRHGCCGQEGNGVVVGRYPNLDWSPRKREKARMRLASRRLGRPRLSRKNRRRRDDAAGGGQ
jgi:hypothetical protein